MPAPVGLGITVPIARLDDIARARSAGRRLALQMGCSESGVALLLTAISELARNIIMYAGSGELVLSRCDRDGQPAIRVIASDRGPGIDDVKAVLECDPAVTGRSGLGLSGLGLVMDHFEIDSLPGIGTRVVCEVLAD